MNRASPSSPLRSSRSRATDSPLYGTVAVTMVSTFDQFDPNAVKSELLPASIHSPRRPTSTGIPPIASLSVASACPAIVTSEACHQSATNLQSVDGGDEATRNRSAFLSPPNLFESNSSTKPLNPSVASTIVPQNHSLLLAPSSDLSRISNSEYDEMTESSSCCSDDEDEDEDEYDEEQAMFNKPKRASSMRDRSHDDALLETGPSSFPMRRSSSGLSPNSLPHPDFTVFMIFADLVLSCFEPINEVCFAVSDCLLCVLMFPFSRQPKSHCCFPTSKH